MAPAAPTTPRPRTYAVTHPDGTVETRPARRHYSHVVVCHTHDPQLLAAGYEASAAAQLDQSDTGAASWYRREAAEIRDQAAAQPDGWYAVARWADNEKAATRAAAGEIARTIRPGQRLYVAAIDA